MTGSRALADRVERELQQAGCSPSSFPHLRPAWLLRDSEVCPYIEYVITHRFEFPQLNGVVGVVVPGFENWWFDNVFKPRGETEHDYGTFGIILSNFEEFWDPPRVDGDHASEAVRKAMRIAKQFPEDRTAYLRLLKQATFLGFSVEGYFGNPTKVRYLNKWLVKNWPEAKGLTLSVLDSPNVDDPYEDVVIDV